MTTELTITTARTGAQAQLSAEGEIDLSTVGELREAVLAAAEGAERVLLDLTRLDFVDTTGLGCLLELRSTLHGRGVLFEIAAADGPVRQAVDVTGLGHLLAVNAD
jgi:anti-sigma B factor antagonist